MTEVRFSPFYSLFIYEDQEENKKGIWETYAVDRFRFLKRIKDFELKYLKMNSIQELIETCVKPNLTTVVFSNLGRRPSLLIYYFNMLFKDLEIVIRSRWNDEVETFCDLLVWLEPEFESEIVKPQYAKSMIVFTSHLRLKYCTNIVGFHLGHSYRDTLITKRVNSIEFKNDNIKIKNHFILKPGPFQTTYDEIPRESNVLIDLTHCRDSHETYVCFMNSFEVLNYYENHVLTWTMCLKSMTQFENDMKICKEKLKEAKFQSATTKCFEKLCQYHFLI